MVPLSVLDLSPVVEGGDAGQALRNSLDLARRCEALGYKRFWMAEHHAMPGVASAATSVALCYVGAGTSTIRIGSGGVMLPNHAPLVIAEQFGTLETLFPGRVDLGLGRAPGTDQMTARALRRTLAGDVDRFPHDVLELMSYFQAPHERQVVQAVPGAGLKVPVWILGSSLFGAQLAAALGLPFAFASHFAPEQMEAAIFTYRSQFQPSEHLAQPYLMLGVNGVAADTDEEARRLYTSTQQLFIGLRTGRPGKLKPPVDDIDARFAAVGMTPDMQTGLLTALLGARDAVRAKLESIVARHAPDELIIVAQIYDHAARVRSYEILAEVRDELLEAA